MPVTFIEIERRKSWRIAGLFAALVLLYFLFALIAVNGVMFFFAGWMPFYFINMPDFIFWIFIAALAIAAVHFLASGYGAVQKVVSQLRAADPDREDGIHRQLLNIAEEIRIASGSSRRIRFMVIPTLSMNALAVTDLRGDAVIAVTEGLVSRLSRSQLEAVIAHEAYHVFSGDCFEASIAASLFGIYASAVDGLRTAVEEDARAVPLLVLFWMLNMLGTAVSMFISREREYRADAGAVKMTRNPIALAEALNMIYERWTGSGAISEGLEMLCISSPTSDKHDVSESWLDNLLSTHPPIRKRIGILLRMAHASFSVLEKSEKDRSAPDRQLYYAIDPDNVWVGPFSIPELSAFAWFSPQTWISSSPDAEAEKAAGLRAFDNMFGIRISDIGYERTQMLCPSCRQPLVKETYERTALNRCIFCQGALVDNDRVTRILARSGPGCDERLAMLLKAVTADNQKSLLIRKQKSRDRKDANPLSCPKCGRQMFRTFYSYAFLIELDKCSTCRVTWFDRDELGMLQCLANNKGIMN